MLQLVRAFFHQDVSKGDSRILKKLYGDDQDGGMPHGPRLVYEVYMEIAKLLKARGHPEGDPELKEITSKMIDAEIARLGKLEQALEICDRERIEFKSSAAIIPSSEASDRLLRYETHLSREMDRILNRLERLQRMRRGQPLPPRLDVNIS